MLLWRLKSTFVRVLLLTCLLVTPGYPAIATLQLSHSVVQQRSATPTLLEQGRTLYTTGRFSEAATVWQRATQVYESQGDIWQQALSLNYLSLAYQELGQWEPAKRAIAQSLALLKPLQPLDQIGLKTLAQTLNTQGRLQLAMGQPEAALSTWQQAAETYAQINDELGRLGSQINQAQALQTLGLYRRAQSLLEHVNQALQQQTDPALKAIGLRSLGAVLQTIGNLEQSRQILEQSLSLAQELHSPLETSLAWFTLANTLRALPDPEAALSYYQQAAAIAPTAIVRIEAQLNQLSLLIEVERWEDIWALSQQIQSQLSTLPPGRRVIYAQVNLAESLIRLLGNWGEAPAQQALQPNFPTDLTKLKHGSWAISLAQQLATAIQQARDLQDARAESYALGQLGKLYEQTQQWAEALELTQQALALAQAANADDIVYQWQWQVGRILRQHSELLGASNTHAEAIAAYTEAVKTLQTLRKDLLTINSEMQFSFKETIEPIYRELIALLLQDELPSQPNLKQVREVIEALQLAELENFFRTACLNAQPQQIDDLDQTAAVLYPILLSDRLAVILSTPGQPLQYYATALPQAEVEETVDQMLQSLNPAFSDRERLRLSETLYGWLIRPAESLLVQQHIQTLVFVLDGVLKNIPMAALHDGQHYLVEKFSIALAPGLQLLSSRSLTQAQLQVLIGGLTEARQGFTSLPGVSTEIAQISAELASEIVLNQEFTAENLQTQVSKTAFPIIHLATHGQFSSKPEETFILTWNNRLSIQDFYTLLQARSQDEFQAIELLVLSACQTAAGDDRAVLGLAGFAVRLGARSTLATLWSVNDQSTALLMTKFYQNLTQQTNVSKAAALRQAQLTLLKNPLYEHPYYWAPFVLVGNWL
jgi:CHAT domain-containing protein